MEHHGRENMQWDDRSMDNAYHHVGLNRSMFLYLDTPPSARFWIVSIVSFFLDRYDIWICAIKIAYISEWFKRDNSRILLDTNTIPSGNLLHNYGKWP